MADRRPLVTPGRIGEIPSGDRVVVGGVVNPDGDLIFEDDNEGPVTLSAIVAGMGGGIGGSTGSTDNALIRASGTGGSTVDASTVVTLSDTGDLAGVGSVTMVGTLDVTGNITTTGTVDGRDVSADWATTSGHIASTTVHLPGSLGTAGQELRVNAGATAPEWFTPTLDDYVPGTATALQVPRRNAADTAFEWATIVVGAGDVVGPAGATDNAFARFDTTTGKLVQNSVVLCSDLGALTGVTDITMTGTLALTGNMTVTGTIDGRDISSDWTTTDAHISSTILHLPSSLGSASQQLRVNAGGTAPEWFTPSGGSGDVVGPASATDNAVARFDSTTGKLIQNSVVTITDTGSVNIPTGQTLTLNTSKIVSLGYDVLTPGSLSTQENNYAPSGWNAADVVRLVLVGAQTITGFAAPTTGAATRKIIQNVDVNTSDYLTILNESASSTAANRVATPGGVSVHLAPGGAVTLDYDATSSRWRVVSTVPQPVILHKVRRSAQLTNIQGTPVFPGYDSTLFALNPAYWSYSSGSWQCLKAHVSEIRTTISYKVNTGAAVMANAGCDIVQGTGGSYTNNLQTHRDSCYSTTDTDGHLTNNAIRAWAVNEQFRVYYYTNAGAMDIYAAMNDCTIYFVSDG